MRESKVEAYLHRQVEAAGGTTRKFKSPGRKNVPDRLVIWGYKALASLQMNGRGGVTHYVECKAPGKDANAAQAREHVRLQKLGCVVLVLDTHEKIDHYVKRNK